MLLVACSGPSELTDKPVDALREPIEQIDGEHRDQQLEVPWDGAQASTAAGLGVDQATARRAGSIGQDGGR